jgi:NADPH-dependent 2,4-dienoyl-CoA reductase/sulfur reductase-like enzyme
MTRRVVVIGGLAAGPSAASKAARTSSEARVILFEQGESVSYGICEIPYFLSGEVKKEGLVAYTPESLRAKKGVDARTLHRVEELRAGRRTLLVRDLRTGRTAEEPFDRLILATGSRPKRLGFEGENARNVFRLKVLEEAFALQKYIEQERPRAAVIIGGGYIGMEMSDALRARGMEVTLLHNQSLPMRALERVARERLREELESHRVTFAGMARVEGFVAGREQKVTHVVTSDGAYEADLVIVAVGVEPNVDLAASAGVRLGSFGGILTDQRQQTSADHIFAAGDCCEVKNLVTNKQAYIPLATIASKAAWTAGENAAGGNATFRGAVRSIALRVFSLEIAQAGLGSEEARSHGFDPVTETITSWSRVAVMPGAAQVSITLIADRKSHRLLGVNAWGTEGAALRANTLAVALQHRMTIEDIRQWDLAYSPPFAPLWDPILVAANATHKKL